MTRSRTLQDLLSLKGRVAVVTGGAGYLGSVISETLAEQGAHVVVCSRDEVKCRRFADALSARFGVECLGIGADLMNSASFEKAARKAAAKFGKINILVNNAWSTKKNTFEAATEEEWKRDMDWLTALFMAVKKTAAHLKKTRGVILNVASMYGVLAPDHRVYERADLANPPGYGTAKAGVIQLTRYLASFLSPHKIRVNAITPGAFPLPETQEKDAAFTRRLSERNPMGRVGEPDDLKGAVALLCSDASKYMTGQNLCVDGGWGVW